MKEEEIVQKNTPLNSQDQPLLWTALEHEDKEHNRDWFWLVGIIALCGSAIALIRGNTLFGIFIIMAGVILFMQRIRTPNTLQYILDEKGLSIAGKLYPYRDMKYFWVETEKSTLLIEMDRFLMPLSTIPLPDEEIDTVRLFMRSFVEEKELKEPFSHKIMEKLGF
ncbi:MAG: hypothetical protein ACI9AR_000207 [Flavobacteriaceae bacterium]|jgi:hypothetical protein